MKKNFVVFLPIFVSLITSCAVYKQEFDCKVPCGVPCTSETDLEAMIVETADGADLFLPKEKESCQLPCVKRKNAPVERISQSLNRKIWLCNQSSESGYYIQGHYIYQSLSPVIEDYEVCWHCGKKV